MRLRQARSAAVGLGLAGLVLLTLLAIPLTDGNLGVVLAPMLVVVGVRGIWRSPLRYAAIPLLFVILCIDNPFEVPFSGLWRSPLSPIAGLIYDNLHKFTGVSALRFSILSVLLIFLLAVGVARRQLRLHLDPEVAPTPKVLSSALFLTFGTMIFLEVWGLARGGDFKQSLWQVQNLLFFPVVAGVFALSLRGPADQKTLGIGIVLCACFKALLGAYFLYFVCRPQGVQPPYVTQHTDSVLFAVALVIPVASWMERPNARHVLFGLCTGPIVVFGMVINDRRLAYVSLGACLITLFLLSPRNKAKRMLSRGLVMALPVLVLYVGVGWTSAARIFKPVQVVRSVVASDAAADDQANSSTEFRNLENYNLVRTWMPSPFLGTGFGHPYSEVLKLPDISKWFPAYRYVPHNSILWLWGIGGVVGFTCLWMVVVIGLLMAARAYRFATRAEDRATALVCICVVITFLNQAFGDMGTQSWESTFLLALALVMGGKLAVVTGAWPAPRRATRLLSSALPSTGLSAGART